MSHIVIEFVTIGLLLLLWQGRRARRTIATIEPPEIVSEPPRIEPPAPPPPPWEPPAPVVAEAPRIRVPVTAAPPARASRRYLLGNSGQITEIERMINGPGLCSPRR